MNYVEQAINKAIDAGYKMPGKSSMMFGVVGDENATFLDPSFWQSLEKILGWEAVCRTDEKRNLIYWPQTCLAGWFYHWHLFIDHLADGKDIESFFKQLLQ